MALGNKKKIDEDEDITETSSMDSFEDRAGKEGLEVDTKGGGGIRWRGVFALLGGFLIQLSLGSFYSFGNMMTYMTSYMRVHNSPNITYGDFIMVQSVWGMTQGTMMPISGYLIQFVGHRVALISGCVLFSAGSALTYFTLEKGLWWVAFTYGFVSAFGQGIALIPTMTIGMRWFPDRKGMAMGVVVGGFGGGAFIFNQIQTAILNPNNVDVGEDGYFTDPDLLSRVPSLMLILAGIYLCIQLLACILMTEPPPASSASIPTISTSVEEGDSEDGRDGGIVKSNNAALDLLDDERNLTPREALQTKEFYILWLTRFSVVLVTQTVAGFYKAFGQTFIADDHYLSFVGAISSIFNCTGRLFYGLLMDKHSYRLAMSTETSLLIALLLSLFATTFGGKIMFAVWIWAIYFTFPGTFSTQPAVTTQTFGHKHGGTIYGFLFSSDIVNNLLLGVLSKSILETWGYLGLFLILSLFPLLALTLTCLFPWHPKPKPPKNRKKKDPVVAIEEKEGMKI